MLEDVSKQTGSSFPGCNQRGTYYWLLSKPKKPLPATGRGNVGQKKVGYMDARLKMATLKRMSMALAASVIHVPRWNTTLTGFSPLPQ